jgi:hypothetical protein
MTRVLTRAALVLAVPMMVGVPLTASAQSSVNPYLPSTTKPPGPLNPAPMAPADPTLQRSTSGVITPPVTDSRMPVIHPRTPSNMPVIPPAGTPGGNPSVIPK